MTSEQSPDNTSSEEERRLRIARLEEQLRRLRAEADAVEAELRDLREVTTTAGPSSTGEVLLPSRVADSELRHDGKVAYEAFCR